MADRRLQLARLLMAIRLPDFWSRGTSASLLVLNYHRIRAAGQTKTDFDDGVFDVDIGTFRRQMLWLRSATQVLDEAAIHAMAVGGVQSRDRLYSAVTFDDGYIDCFALVKPVLDELGIRAIFFIPVEILSRRRLGWWDQAAYMLKRSPRRAVSVRGEMLPLGERLQGSLKRVLDVFKLEPAERTASLLAELADACGVEPPSDARQDAELMTWDQVRLLRGAGHSIGSHAWSHRPLATLTAEEQSREIRESRSFLQETVGSSIDSFAYPVGGPLHFTETSASLVREAGYRQAFSFNTGVAGLPIADRFRIARESAKSFDLLKAKALMPGFMGLRSKSAA